MAQAIIPAWCRSRPLDPSMDGKIRVPIGQTREARARMLAAMASAVGRERLLSRQPVCWRELVPQLGLPRASELHEWWAAARLGVPLIELITITG